MNTIADIAKIAGVAKSTVSRYLNGGSISDKTKKKIEKVMEETGYMPNTFAQSLKAKKTNIIGIIVPRLDSYATARTLIGIDEFLRECNYQMFVSNTSLDLEREIESILTLTKQKVAGIILLATEITERHIEIIKTIQIPVIVVGQEHQQLYSIVHNDYEAAYELGKYVLEQGHRKIAYLGVSEKDIAVGVKRKEGFKKAMQEIKGCEVKYFETSFKIAEALIKVPSIIKEYQPSMIVCATDNIAIGALKAAYMNGLTIPKDLSITGFGGYEVTEMMNPGLTTAKFFYQDAGRMAANSIVKLVNGEKISKKTLSKFKIIIRESVDKLNINQL
ncbi:LacI family transcriptional regulator [Anaerobacillus alkalilacustris]|uniref:LacI family transcriptional regulator n=1 Tax=Anaerobacillus alkalilacustris TaxID=393763 RepID=A0A1S2LI88_9BACI|nr:LacI family DNA-binding transcriptional regulator [Anaerobacillus alkalilacustris]OIJ12096.1 LacI family transcriptional regulator [Anaerobacillus alkalilacustris]